jgi:thymidine kinase
MAECIICRDDEDTIKNNDEIVIKCNECDNISCKKCIEEYLLQTSRTYPHCPNSNKYIEIHNIKKDVLKNLIYNMIKSSVNTHNQNSLSCISTDNLTNNNLKQLIKNYDIILIDEGQFFKDLYNFCKNITDTTKKIIYVFGLSGDSNRNKFGEILDLIPISDNITHLKSICNICSEVCYAPFTLRTSDKTEQVIVGSSNDYMAVCRKCWLNNN